MLNSLESEQRHLIQKPKQMKSWEDSKKKEKLSLEKGDAIFKQKKTSPQPQEEEGTTHTHTHTHTHTGEPPWTTTDHHVYNVFSTVLTLCSFLFSL